MKKLIFGLIAVVMFGGITNAQTFRTENKTCIIESKSVDSNVNSIIVEVKITNKETKETLPDFVYKFTSDNKGDLKKELSNNSKNISGVFTVSIDNQLLYTCTISNGSLKNAKSYTYNGTSAEGKAHPCTIKGQFACIDDKLENMNWVEYGACLLTAPECYAMLHASCAWDNCH